MLSNDWVLINDTVVYTHSNNNRYRYSNLSNICTPDALTVKILLCTHIVDGGWSSQRGGLCSKTCGGGTKTLTRSCNNPVPFCGGKGCSGPSNYQIACNTHCCPGKIILINDM